MPYKNPIKAREASKLRQRKYCKKPGQRERQNERMRELRKDPVFRANELAKLRARNALPENRIPRLAKIREKNKKQRQLLNLLKSERGCYDCGGMFPPEALDWDHMPGQQKSFNIGPNAAHLKLEKVLAEINKCQLVCATCHRIRTVTRKEEKI